MVQRDANLLLGIFAAQLKLVTPQQLVTAGSVWASDQTRALGEILQTQGVLTSANRALLEQLISQQVADHGGDASQVYELFGGDDAALASFGGSLGFSIDSSAKRYASIATPSSQSRASGAGSMNAGAEISLPLEHAGRYSLHGERGRGGIGRVLVAFDAAIQREIALKELLPTDNVSQRWQTPSSVPQGVQRHTSAQVARFLREARITGQLEHPGIVPVYELGQRQDGTVYYTMKLVRGATLADKLRACQSLADRLKLLAHFLDLCQAIAYAHSRGVVHRDIKPANVMVGEFGETVLLDWGLAKVRGQADDGAEKLAEEVRELKEADAGESIMGKPIGTPSYMPPEQADGRIDDIDERSDLWSLGAVLYEILTGKPPFTGVSAFEVIGAVLSDEVQPALQRCPEAPAELAAIAMRCLQRTPADRYQRVEQLARDIGAFQTGGLVSAYSYSAPLMLQRWARKHWAVLATSGVGLLLLCGLAVFSYTKVFEQRNAALSALARLDKRNNELLGLKLAAESREQLAAGQSERASLLALQAEHFYRRSSNWMPEVDRALRDSLGAPFYSHVLSFSPANVDRAIFLPDGQHLAAESYDLAVWDLKQPGSAAAVYRHGSSTLAASADGQWIATGHDGTMQHPQPSAAVLDSVLLWSVQHLDQEPRVLSGLTGLPLALAFSPDNRLLAAGDEKGLTLVWDLAQLDAAPRMLRGHTDKVLHAVFSPDSQTLATVSSDKTVRVWDLSAAARPPRSLQGHTAPVYGATITPDGKQLITSGADDTIRFWNLAQLDQAPRVLTVHPGGGDMITSVALSPDGSTLAASSYDDKLIFLYAMDHLDQAPQLLRGHENGINSVEFSPDGSQLASCANDWTVRTWQIGSAGREPQVLLGQEDSLSAAFAPDGKRVAVAGTNPCVAVWDLDHPQQPALKLSGTTEMLRKLAWSSDGRWLAAGGAGLQVLLWDMRTPEQPPLVCATHPRLIRSVVFSPDNRWLATNSDGGTVCLTSLEHPERPPVVADSRVIHVHSLAFSPDSKILVLGGEGRIQTYAVPDLTHPVQDYTAVINHMMGLAFSPDGKRLASVGRDALVRLWQADDLAAGSQEFRGHDGWLYTVAYAPDGRFIASGGKDNTVRLWDPDNPAAPPEVLLGQQNTVIDLAFAPDGKTLVSTSQNAPARIWHVGHTQLVGLVERQPWRNLTRLEWRTFVGNDVPYEATLPALPSGQDDIRDK